MSIQDRKYEAVNSRWHSDGPSSFKNLRKKALCTIVENQSRTDHGSTGGGSKTNILSKGSLISKSVHAPLHHKVKECGSKRKMVYPLREKHQQLWGMKNRIMCPRKKMILNKRQNILGKHVWELQILNRQGHWGSHSTHNWPHRATLGHANGHPITIT